MTQSPRHQVDTHQHLWVMSERSYDWIAPEYGVLYNDFRPEDVIDDSAKAGITATVLVQAADTYDDTFYMLSVGKRFPTIRGVVGWVPFNRPDEAEQALDLFSHHPLVKGCRNLTHNYDDARWILQDSCMATLKSLSERGLVLDMVAVANDYSKATLEIADALPDLTIVVDHMFKPPVASAEMEPWSTLMTDLAQRPNIVLKHSGLNTASAEGWTVADWKPYIDHALNTFGPDRMMLGSDWPVSLLNGDFAGVWAAQLESVSHLSPSEFDAVCFETANRVYSLGLD